MENITGNILTRFSLFADISDDTIGKLQKDIRFRTLRRDEVLLLEGGKSTELYFVLKGWLKAEKVSPDGRVQVLRFIGPAEVINELSVFSNEKNAVSVIAEEEAEVFSIPKASIERLLAENPLFVRGVIKSLAQRIQHLLDHVENLSFYPVEVRLARFLLAESQGDIVLRQSWKTQSEIASRLGTVLDVLNRQLQKLANEGVIEIERDQIRILNRPVLEEIARG